jgi:hypothetical protein
MTLAELIARARVITDDTVAPYFASDADMTLYANRAEREACERANLLYDTARITLVPGQSIYALEYELLAVVFAAIGTRELRKLIPTDLDWLSAASPAVAVPVCFSQREQFVEVYPTPDAAGTLALKLYRYPLSSMESLGDEPEIALYHQEYLAHWMAFEAMTPGSEDEQPTKPAKSAEQQLMLFTQRFGRARTATEIRSWRELPRGTVARSGFVI